MMTNTSSNVATPENTLTFEKLQATLRQCQELARNIPPPVRFVESPYATTRHQAKVYPKRKAKNASHLKRMNNKWIRRYGYRHVPAAYWVNTKFIGAGDSQTLVAHPAIIGQIRRAVHNGSEVQK